jgi:hypothetical protein
MTEEAALHRRALHRPERTEYATLARVRPQQNLALRAFIDDLATVGRHDLALGMAAVGAGNLGFEDDGVHVGAQR